MSISDKTYLNLDNIYAWIYSCYQEGYTTTYYNKWEGGVVNYNFVSNGKDNLKYAAFFVDEKIGYSQATIN